VEAEEAAQERIEHVQRAILHVLAHNIVTLLLKPPDNMGREEPQTKVDPTHNHKSVEDDSNQSWEDVYRQLEKGSCKVSHIVQYHYCCADRKHIERIREENKSPSHQVVKHVLREVGS